MLYFCKHSNCILRKLAEKKRRIYDEYGKDGLGDRAQSRSHARHHYTHDFDDFDIMGGFPFVFRPPEEVFREFFGVNSPFADFFRGAYYKYTYIMNDIVTIPLSVDANGYSQSQNGAPSSSRRHGGHGGGNLGSGSSSRHHHHHHQHKLASPFGAPMLNYSMMDFFMPTSGFTSFTASNSVAGGGLHSNGAVKRTSTSTVFVNGKKLMTKR